jgi:hypothetical protein
MLSYGVCVKTCPTGDKNTPIDCKTTTYMAGNNKYTDCVYYPDRRTGFNGTPFRYASVNVLNAFCIPNADDYVD